METCNSKRRFGRFFTRHNVFKHQAFRSWLKRTKCRSAVDPFAGDGAIAQMLPGLQFTLYDISPASERVISRNSLKSFPRADLCITNPPYFSTASAALQGVILPPGVKRDLYVFCLNACLANCEYVAAILPLSFMSKAESYPRLATVIELTSACFDDTDVPVCLALFCPTAVKDVKLYRDKKYLGSLSKLLKLDLRLSKMNSTRLKIIFNHPKGKIGLVAYDNQMGMSFVLPHKIKKVKSSSRHLTIIKYDSSCSPHLVIAAANIILEKFRRETSDVFLSPVRDTVNGKIRRRLKFSQARRILQLAIAELERDLR